MSKKKKAWGENGFEDWGGYMAAKKAKLEEQFKNEAQKECHETSSLFQGIAIFVNGYTNPTADELRRLMMAHGGVYHHYMRPRITTHIIASNLPYSKIVLYRKSQNPIPICKPEWITDSIKSGKILNFQNYLLYSNCTDVQPQLMYKVKSKQDPVKVESRDAPPVTAKDDRHVTFELPKTESANQSNPSTSKVSNVQARCTKDSGFLSEFYSHSRLHHIATMGATFKDYVNELRDKNRGRFPGLDRLKTLKASRDVDALSESQSSIGDDMFESADNKIVIRHEPVIMHIDMDCFFVSVGLRNKPELNGFPVAVTHAKGNKQPSSVIGDGGQEIDDVEIGSLSEVASCSYEARKAGVKNGMFLGEALKLCPTLKTIPYDFEGYKEVSYALYNTVASYTLDIEAVSCDEMYADCTKILEESCLTPLEFASIVRHEIREKTGCPVSTGFGANKLLARLATKKAKPDGQYCIEKEQVNEHIGCLNCRDLPGVGWSTAQRLNAMNVRSCAELQRVSLSILQKEFGKKTGEILHNMCRGVDNSKLSLEHVRKSVSAEVNYGIRFENNDDAVEFLKKLSVEVCSRLNKANAKGRCITLKAMVRAKEAPKETAKFMGHGLCDYTTKSKNLIAPINDVNIITKEVLTLWNQLQQLPEDMRGIGIQISRLEILKTKSHHASLTNFINKAKPTETLAQHVVLKNPNDTSYPKNTEDIDKVVKSNDLRTFFSSKKSSAPSTSVPQHSANLRVPCDVDSSVLAELPEDIRNEILGIKDVVPSADVSAAIKKDDVNTASKKMHANNSEEVSVVSRESNNVGQKQAGSEVNVGHVNTGNLVETLKKKEKDIQTRQENFFKQTKPNVTRPGKVELPALQEIDMNVLLDLPEDIRNEILNEYSNNRREQKSEEVGNKKCISTKPTTSTNETVAALTVDVQDEQNISFSQIDPEFLAALSDELKQDVQVYCNVKKRERISKTKMDSNAITMQSNNTVRGSNFLKQGKTVERASKSRNNGKSTKEGSKSNKKKKLIPTSKVSEPKPEAEDRSKCKNNEVESIIKNPNKIIIPETEAILSHNLTISSASQKTSEHQEILIGLVNRLINLPLNQVKMQIQTWIVNSGVVNEVDFLSIATFLSMLPEKKRIEDLHVLVKTMHRCMTKTGNCIWHKTYRKTVKHVQHYMRMEYNSDLMVPPLRCDLLNCNSDLL